MREGLEQKPRAESHRAACEPGSGKSPGDVKQRCWPWGAVRGTEGPGNDGEEEQEQRQVASRRLPQQSQI